MRRPIAVLISDLHFTVPTLELASQALLKAQFRACIDKLPLIICGDTLDSKAIMRAECVNRLLKMLCVVDAPKTYMLVGNHDLCNEKGNEHSLNFLRGCVTIVDVAQQVWLGGMGGMDALLMSYQSDIKKFESIAFNGDTPSEIIICHQGFIGADVGHYVLDKSSIDPERLGDFRVISGHYHKRQDIPRTNISYLGNPYTLGFGEANHGPKGYNILYSDGSLELVPLNLSKHVIAERTPATVYDPIEGLNGSDHLLLKVTGTDEELRLLNKQDIGKKHLGHSNYRLDLIPTDSAELKASLSKLTSDVILDKLIDAQDGTPEHKTNLKSMWRELINADTKS